MSGLVYRGHVSGLAFFSRADEALRVIRLKELSYCEFLDAVVSGAAGSLARGLKPENLAAGEGIREQITNPRVRRASGICKSKLRQTEPRVE